jgi:peptidoglycan/xylan/chitin deacetylase (PgdA/CDA1 family)
MMVLMFHSLGLENSAWEANYLSVPWRQFAFFLEYLHKKHYATPFLDDWYEQVKQTQSYANHIYLTFDDGYLDNWVYLFPLLEKYQIKATIFINPEFIDPSATPRLNLKQVWNRQCQEADLDALGFLNWQEISIMQQSGLVDIQSHSMSHNWYFSAAEIIDITDGSNNLYYWLEWPNQPLEKPFYIKNNIKRTVPAGIPVFKYGRSLAIRRYFPPADLTEQLKEWQVKHKIPESGFSPKQKQAMMAFCRQQMISQPHGRMESDQEMIQRYYDELINSKKILQEKLHKPIDFLCWPGGGYNDLSLEISKQAGYKASTISSADPALNDPQNPDYPRIRRQSFDSSFTTPHGGRHLDVSPAVLIHRFLERKGTGWPKYWRRLKKLWAMTKEFIG